uniref:winged helix-turn-helix domain-containing protein n=1 Tax=Streptomyces tendae TaxID=1932 RepID=UPI00384DF1CB
MIGRRFDLACTVQGVRKLLVRNGWSCQVSARRARGAGRRGGGRTGRGGVGLRARLAAARGA